MSKWKDMAERTTILRCLVGSQAYGLALGGKSDRDERGVCVEDFDAFMSLTGKFEQLEYRTATERTGDKDAKSEAGDLDLTIYGLSKFLRLALGGNPNIIEMLFIRGDCTIKWEQLGTALQDLYPLIVSKRAGGAYLGYIKGQRQRYFDNKGEGSRQALVEEFGYDVKAASHVIRLGCQGIELLTEGKLILPMSGMAREWALQIKQGKWKLEDVLQLSTKLENMLKQLIEKTSLSSLREHPDTEAVESWMRSVYLSEWNNRRTFVD